MRKYGIVLKIGQWVPEWLQRSGMVITHGKISTGLPGPSGLTDGIDHL